MNDHAQPPHGVTRLLQAHSEGDATALDRLIPLVYDDLRRIARSQLAGETPGHTLDTRAVVHEAYLRLADRAGVSWPDRSHFYAFASRVMRHVLIDHGRRRQRRKRGGGMQRVPLERVALSVTDPVLEVVALDEALTRLSEQDERAGRVAECRLFGGMNLLEIAGVLGVSLRTVERDWSFGKAFLYRGLVPEASPGRSGFLAE